LFYKTAKALRADNDLAFIGGEKYTKKSSSVLNDRHP